MVVEAVTLALSQNGWTTSNSFPNPKVWFKGVRQINISGSNMNLYAGGDFLSAVAQVKFLQRKDKVVEWFIKS